MLTMLPGLEERVIMVVTPAEVARRAATILVDIPPVPRREPALDTLVCFDQFIFRNSEFCVGVRRMYHLLVMLQCLRLLQ